MALAQSAQRLSASMRLAQRQRLLSVAVFLCSTPFGIYEVGTGGFTAYASRFLKCSTPFGIYEVGTFAFWLINPPYHKVLNAFRHL